MSRTFKDRGYQRKKVKNSFLQKICMSYSDDFKAKNSGRAYTHSMIRHRIKKIDKVDINDSQLRDVINNFNESDEYERMIR